MIICIILIVVSLVLAIAVVMTLEKMADKLGDDKTVIIPQFCVTILFMISLFGILNSFGGALIK